MCQGEKELESMGSTGSSSNWIIVQPSGYFLEAGAGLGKGRDSCRVKSWK